MPRIDPLQLLNCLNVLLTPTGGIKSEQEVARISSLMEKFSKKLVSKCVYLLILKNSDPHLLSKFMGLGGWNLIHNWMTHAVEAKNYPFLIELLEVILICPVDIERLKSNPMPRQVKNLTREESVHPRVKELASDIVKHWLAIVKSTPPSTTPATTAPLVATPASENISRLKEGKGSPLENRMKDVNISSEASGGGDGEDETYSKSTSPSSSSLDSDDSDVFVPYKKSQAKTRKKPTPIKKEKAPIKKSIPDEKRKLKSKLITSSSPKGDKPAAIKLKIEVTSNSSSESKSKKTEEKSLEEKLKEKRKLKEEKEREKFARFKQEREKKEKRDKHDTHTNVKQRDKLFDEKVMGELSKLIPKPLDKLGRIPKINKDKEKEKENAAVSNDKLKDDKKLIKVDEKKLDKKEEKPSNAMKENDKNKEKDIKKDKEEKKVPIPIPPPKKPVSISVEKRSAGEVKPKTVKAYNSKFRLTGLEQEIPKPAARKLSNLPSSSPNSTSSGYEKLAVKRSPPRDIENEPMEKKLRSPDSSFTEEKLSPAPNKSNKKPFLQESDSFMNAMDVALLTQKEQLRKRKKPPPKSDSESKNDEAPVVAPVTPVVARKNSDTAVSSPTLKTENPETKPAFKFYKDTLETSAEESTETTEKKEIKPVLEIKAEPKEEEKVKEIVPVNDPMKPKSAVGLKSALSLFRTKKLPKKSVSWKTDEELESVQFFEVDATERTNVVRNFWEMQMMERTKERDMMMVRKIGENDKMAVQMKWKPLIPIDLVPPTTARGSNSQEKNIQYARERAVPPSLYYNKSMIPDTPAEPDLEIHPVTVPPIIPLDDISGSQDSINDFSAFKWPEPKQFPPDNIDMNMMKGFMAAGMPPPIFPPFPDGAFPPPFAQPFFPGGTVPPLPVPNNWNANSTDSNQQSSSTSTSMPWVPPGVVPPPGMIGPPPFGMLGPFPPIPGAGFPPNMFPMNTTGGTGEDTTTAVNSDNQQYSNTNYPTTGNNNEASAVGGNSNVGGGNSNSGSGSGGGNSSNSNSERKKWTNDDRYYSKKDSWRNNYNDRSRDKRGSGSWRGSGGNSRLCRIFQKKGYCSVSGCRFYHPDKN